MTNAATIITGAQVALSIIRELQKAVNAARDAEKELTVEDVQNIILRNRDAEAAWEQSKADRRAAEVLEDPEDPEENPQD